MHTQSDTRVERAAYSIKEWGKRYDIGPTSVYKLIKEGRLRPVQILGATRILASEDERFRASLEAPE